MERGKMTPLMLAAIVAVLIVGGSVWYKISRPAPDPATKEEHAQDDVLQKIQSVQADDHVRGNPNAPLVFVVYSDFGCPYCKEYHSTMAQILDLYGRDGKVAWVFRHMPVVQLHPGAPMYALASECVAHKAGNAAFWTFADGLFAAMSPDTPVDASGLVTLAEKAGVDRQVFTECMRANEYMKDVEDDFNEVLATGVEGTPVTVVLSPQQRISFEGAQSFAALTSAVRTVLPVLGATTLEKPTASNSAGEMFTKQLEMRTTSEATATGTPPQVSTSTPSSTTATR